MVRRHLTFVSLAVALAFPALAQQYVYPAKGQKPEQQKADEASCHGWAVQQSGFDPAKPPPPPAAPAQPTTATGTTPGAGLRGAAVGGVIGGVADGDAGKAAAVGAVAARHQSRRQNSQQAAAQQQQQQAATGQGQASFLKARAACLEGKGYTVK